MIEERYDLMFSGELVPGFELGQVKKNLQQLFRLDEAKINALFCGKPIPLKKGVDADAANKYRVAMKKAGARVDLVLAVEAPPAPALNAQPAAQTKLSNGGNHANTGKDGNSGEGKGMTTALGAQPVVAKKPRVPIQAPDFGVAPPGTELLSPKERRRTDALEVNISHLAVTPQEGNLIKDDEIDILPGIPVTVPDLEITAAGADLLKPEERETVQAVKIDVSHLSVAKVGERLGPVSPPAPAPPNVDHLKLKT